MAIKNTAPKPTAYGDIVRIASNVSYFLEVAKGNIPGEIVVHKYGKNADIDTGGFEAIWNGGGDYTGQDCTAAETLETFSSSANDAGTLLSSGTSTSGSKTTLIDSGATFSTDTVAVGDVLINDTKIDHGLITAVTETQLTVARMAGGSQNDPGDSYRVATPASSGSAIAKLSFLLDGNLDNETAEYIILNGITGVDTVGTYMRHSRGRAFCGAVNVGTITTRQKTTTANVTMVMPIGYGASMISAYTIPRGKHAYFTDWFAAWASKKTGFSNVRLMVRPVNCVFQVKEELAAASDGGSYVPRQYRIPKDSLSEMSDIKIMADTSINDLGLAGGFDLWMIDNE